MMMMMVKNAILLIAIGAPVIFCSDCDYPDPGGGADLDLELNLCGSDFQTFFDIPFLDGQCTTCERLADMAQKVAAVGGRFVGQPSAESVDKCCTFFNDRLDCITCESSVDYLVEPDNLCNDCKDVAALASIRDENDNLCCTELVDILLDETVSAGSSDSYNSPDESCIHCKDLKKLARNTNCKLHQHNTCYLFAQSGSSAYDPPTWSIYHRDSDIYKNTDYGTGYNSDYASYEHYDQVECGYGIVSEYLKAIPHHCEIIGSLALDCPGYGIATETKCPQCPDKCDKDYIPENQCPSCPVYDSNTASGIEQDTTDKSVETIGWVLIAISGVLFLTSIVFFMSGRNERKAAAENRMAGHGVMA